MADLAALVAEFRAALKNVGDVDYNIGLRSLSVKMRFIKPLADARDGKPIVDGISALPHILDALEAARAGKETT